MASTPTTLITKSAAAAAKDAVTLTTTRAAFSPRTTFAVSTDLPRSFFLGHHRAGLDRMRHALANIGLIIECRDFRVPLTSWNPLLETSLVASSSSQPSSTTRRANPDQRSRIIVYTHRDLTPSTPATKHTQALLRDFHLSRGQASAVLFTTGSSKSGYGQETGPLLRAVTDVARARDALTGLRALVVGMPNAGKSTLLNALRRRGLGEVGTGSGQKGKTEVGKVGKVAKTGAEPGVTRKLSSPVRIVRGESSGDGEFSEGVGEGVFVVDTPGVFIPYVSDPEAMLKLALVGCVRDGLVARETLADYLLYQLNRDAAGEDREGGGSAGYVTRLGMGGPTNDVNEFLEAVARRVGKVSKGGGTNFTAAAEWAVQEWRRGGLGRVILDDVTPESLESTAAKGIELSMNQARKRAKEERKVRNAAKRLGSPGGGETDA